MLPGCILFTFFVILPLVYTLRMGFYQSDGLSQAVFVGFDNFKKLFHDTYFFAANTRSLKLMILAIVFNACLGLATAIILVYFFKDSSQNAFRTIFLLPLVLSITVISQLWLSIYDAEWGLLNQFLNLIGLGQFQTRWLIEQETALVSVAIVGMWQYFGWLTLLSYAGLKTIPTEYFEAASIDGANFLTTTRKITLPLMSDTIKMILVISTVGGLFTFPQVYIMTGGGPGTLTQTVMMFIYSQVFSSQHFGYGCAASTLVIIEIIVILLIIFKFTRSEHIEK